MMFDLTDKRAVVTGATGGIGEAIARAYAKAGAKVLLTGRNNGKLEALQADIGANASVFACDLADEDAPAALTKAAADALGGADILVCNAGITKDNLAMRMKDEEWDEVAHVNLRQAFRLIRENLRGMMKQRNGRIITVTSVVGTTGNPGQANYCAAKAGLTGMTKALAQELAARGITANCIAPGFIATPMTDALNDAQREGILKAIPAGRMGSPDDIAAAALYLASDEAAYVTGATLHVNGGMVMV